jgi:hypothetical protein
MKCFKRVALNRKRHKTSEKNFDFPARKNSIKAKTKISQNQNKQQINIQKQFRRINK